jgi:hypothetical protein
MALDALYERDGLMAPHIAPSEICGWEHGRHLPSTERQDYLCRVYRTRPDRLGFGADYSGGNDREFEVEDSDMDRRTVIKLLGSLVLMGLPMPLLDAEHVLSAAAGPRRIDAGLLHGLRSVHGKLVSWRTELPPSVLLNAVRGHLGYLRTLFEGPVPPAFRQELGGLTGEAALFAGWLSFSGANVGQARAYFTYARQVALELDHRSLHAHTLMRESLLHSQVLTARSARDTEVALRLLDQAAEVRAQLPAPLRACLAAQQSEEFALLKQVNEYHRAFEEAQQAVAQITSTERTGLMSDWTEPRLAAYEGSCLLQMGDARAAAAVLEDVLRDKRALTPSIGLMARVDLGAARIMHGEVAEGARLIGDAHEEARASHRDLVVVRAVRTRERLKRWQNDPSVSQLDERLALPDARTMAAR